MPDSTKKQTLKNNFEPGDIPTSQNFNDLIDMATNASDIDAGILSQERIPSDLALSSVSGDGSALTNLNASEIMLGTISSERLQNATDEVTGAVRFATEAELAAGNIGVVVSASSLRRSIDDVKMRTDNQLASVESYLPEHFVRTSFSGDGSRLSALNADNIDSGELNAMRLPPATEQTAGAIRIATQEEIQAQTANNLAITPAALAQAVDQANSRQQEDINMMLAQKADVTYVDAQLTQLEAGLKFKKDVDFVANVAVITGANASLIELDGVMVDDGDRVLLTAQPNAQDNRVWIARRDAPWDIAEDFNEIPEGEIFVGTSVEVKQGDSFANSIWSVAQINPVNGQRLELSWRKRNDVPQYQAGEGVIIDGLQIRADRTWIEGNYSSSEPVNYQAGAGISIDNNSISVDQSWLQSNTLDQNSLSTQITQLRTELNSQLRRIDTGSYEQASAGVEYYSPNQHGGYYGVVIRKYLNALQSRGGTLAQIPESELIDYKLILTHDQGWQTVMNSTNFSETESVSLRLMSSGALILQLSPGFELRSAWVDYVKKTLKILSVDRRWLKSYDLAQSASTNLVSLSNSSIHGIEVDTRGKKLYWKEYNESSSVGWIKRANFDGSHVEDVLEVGMTQGLVIDPLQQKIYWCDWSFWFTQTGKGILYRANLDGTDKESIYSNEAHLGNTRHLSLDLSAGKIYWFDMGDRNILYRANLDGSNFESMGEFTTGHSPNGIAIDSTNNHIYWTSYFGETGRGDDGCVKRANLDGTAEETLIAAPNARMPRHLELDIANDHLYFIDNNGSDLKRANLNGSNIETIPGISGNYFSLYRE